jgi:hypothetical protein
VVQVDELLHTASKADIKAAATKAKQRERDAALAL